ncbi:MAG: NADH-quinone oxidoreductase subunit N [Nitrospiraceae bacterium]|nr:NADH-quinone oxidoreductase subunit N [Nitrospiraceae bacterium]
MTTNDFYALSPLLAVGAAALAVMIGISVKRSMTATAGLTVAGLFVSFAMLFPAASIAPRIVTPLLVIDGYALFYMGLVLAGTLTVVLLSLEYLRDRGAHPEEYYILLLLAAFGSMTLVASRHFGSLFLGLEILSVSLYGLIAYVRGNEKGIEAGIKYLVLAAVSAAFLVFGMALVYTATGSLEFSRIGAGATPTDPLFLAGAAMIIVGMGFKLAVVPFHLWTPDVYEGAPAPVTAFIATVSKGAVFALLLRLAGPFHILDHPTLFTVFSVIAVGSIFAGNLLALSQGNIKRILAYSSIAHLGYLLVAFLAGGVKGATAATYYLSAYFVTTLGAFGVISLRSGRDREREYIHDYRGLAWRRPWLAGVFTAMLLSLAGIPLTAGFIGKFYAISAGVGSSLWFQVVSVAIGSAIGLFYYLRVISVMYAQPERHSGGRQAVARAISFGGGMILALLTLGLILLGVWPSPLIGLITRAVSGMN